MVVCMQVASNEQGVMNKNNMQMKAACDEHPLPSGKLALRLPAGDTAQRLDDPQAEAMALGTRRALFPLATRFFAAILRHSV